MHSIKNDNVLGTLKFVAKGEDYQKQAATRPKISSSLTADAKIIFDDTNVPDNKPSRRRRKTGVTIKDTPTVIKKRTPEQSLKLKIMKILFDAAMLEEDIRKAIKANLYERTESKKETTESGKNDDDISIDLDETDDEEYEHADDETQRDDYMHEDDEYMHEEEEHVHDYVEEELNDAEIAKIVKEIAKIVKGNKELYDPNKAKVGKTEEANGDKEQVDNALARVDQARYASTQDNQAAPLKSVTQKGKPELPPTSSSISVSSRFGNQFIALSFDISLTGTLKDNTDAEINSIPHDDEDPPVGPDQGLNKRKTRKDVELSKKPKSIGSSKDTTQSQSKSTGKSTQAEETVFKVEDTNMSLNQGDDLGNTDEQPNVKADPKHDWFKKPAILLLLIQNGTQENQLIDGPEKSWLNDLANTEKPPFTFDDLMSTPIDFSAFSMNRLKISKLTKVDLVRPVYNLLKGTCKSYVEQEYNIEECYLALSDQLDWNNPKGNRYPYDLSKPLPLHESQGRLTFLTDFFFNNDFQYLRGGSIDRKYTASTTKTKATKYEIEGIEYMVPKLWSPIKAAYNKYAALGSSHWGSKRQTFYGHMINREIVVKRADQKLYKFMEDDFQRLYLNDIEDMLLLIVQNRLNNLEGNVIVDLVVALRMYTRRIFIRKRVKDLQLGLNSTFLLLCDCVITNPSIGIKSHGVVCLDLCLGDFRMELYMLNRQHGKMILESVEHGPLLWPTVEEDGVTRLKKYYELSAAEAIRKATNIILQALLSEIYALKENFVIGKKFPNSKMINEMITRVAVKQKTKLHLKKIDKKRLRCICRGKVPQFSCEDGDDVSGSKGVGSDGSKSKSQSKEKGQESIYLNPKIPLNALKDQLQKPYKVGILNQKVFRAKKMAYERIEGLLKDGFKARKRDLLGLDGCFLSGTYPRWILTAVGVDPNNGIYPLAYAIVESANKDSWKWFLDCIGDDL
nr:hypothetical protein [Tanacetum cinerariifolium]